MFIVYEIHKLDTPTKNYIGKTSMAKWIKGYMGSGNVITEAIKKHGEESYGRKLLAAFDDEDLAYAYETKLIAEKDPYYNADGGGRGVGSGEKHPMFGRKQSEEAKKKMVRRGADNGMYGKKRPDLAQNNKDRYPTRDVALMYLLRVNDGVNMMPWYMVAEQVDMSRSRVCFLTKEFAKENNLPLWRK